MDELTCTHGLVYVVVRGEVVWTGRTCAPCDAWVRGIPAQAREAVAAR